MALIVGDAHRTREDLVSKIDSGTAFFQNNPKLSSQPKFFLRPTDVKAASTQKDIFLLFGGIGSTIVATMYAFIIARFRTREIAVLKAVGFTAKQVRTVLLAEIAMVSFIGFFLAVIGIQILVTANSFITLQTSYVPNVWIFWNILLNPLSLTWIPSLSAIAAFLI